MQQGGQQRVNNNDWDSFFQQSSSTIDIGGNSRPSNNGQFNTQNNQFASGNQLAANQTRNNLQVNDSM